MTSATWTQEDLNELEKAIALGAKEVEYRDKRVVYRTLAEMRETRDMIRNCLNGSNVSRVTRIKAKCNKGFC